MELHVLGAGSILPREGYGCAGYALRPSPGARVTLLDCGPGSLRRLPAAGIGLEEVERVVLSHEHPDHCLDLFALAFARRSPHFVGRLPRLEIVGPRGTGGLVERGGALSGTKAWTRFEDAEVVEVEPDGGFLERGPLRFAWAPTRHTPTAVAWRVEHAGASLTYSGDTGESEAVAALARGTDLFVLECSFPDEHPVERHLTPSACGRMAARAGCARLLLTHFYPDNDPEVARASAAHAFRSPIELARDGSRHLVP